MDGEAGDVTSGGVLVGCVVVSSSTGGRLVES